MSHSAQYYDHLRRQQDPVVAGMVKVLEVEKKKKKKKNAGAKR